MDKKIFVSLAIVVLFALVSGGTVFANHNPLHDKIIALDSGHDDVAYGASNVINGVLVTEAEVNLSVVNALKLKLEEQGAHVVVADRLATRKDRVNDAIAKCALFDLNNDGVGDKCDVLISVHHNGSIDANYDGTLAIYNEKKDKPLAEKMLAALTPLTTNGDGLLNGGYGMTVYGNLVSVITEAYFISNDCEAELYLTQTTNSSCNKTIYPDGDRVDQEAQLQVVGLSNYFASLSTGGKGGKPR